MEGRLTNIRNMFTRHNSDKHVIKMSRHSYDFYLRYIADAWTIGSPIMLQGMITFLTEFEPK